LDIKLAENQREGLKIGPDNLILETCQVFQLPGGSLACLTIHQGVRQSVADGNEENTFYVLRSTPQGILDFGVLQVTQSDFQRS
jgi:hypothetical protein